MANYQKDSRKDEKRDFLTWFGLTGLIFDDTIPLDALLSSLSGSSVQPDILRKIIYSGLEAYYDQSKDTKSIQNIHRQLHNDCVRLRTRHETLDDSKSDIVSNHCHYVFSVDSLICHTFEYLDFSSMIECSKVSRHWLHKCYDPASFYFLDFDDLFKINYVEIPQIIFQLSTLMCPTSSISFVNISRFQNVKSIRIQNWPRAHSKTFDILSIRFKKIEHITITQPQIETYNEEETEDSHVPITYDSNYASTVEVLLRNNCNNIKSITLNVESDEIGFYSHDSMEYIEHIVRNELQLPKLTTLILNGTKGGFVPAHAPNLRCVKLWGIPISLESMTNCLENKNTWRNVTELHLGHWVVTDEEMENTLADIVCKLFECLTNLAELRVEEFYTKASFNFLYQLLVRLPHPSKLETLCFEIYEDDEYMETFETFISKHKNIGTRDDKHYFCNLKNVDIRLDNDHPQKMQFTNMLESLRCKNSESSLDCDESDLMTESSIEELSVSAFINVKDLSHALVSSGLLATLKKIKLINRDSDDIFSRHPPCKIIDIATTMRVVDKILISSFPGCIFDISKLFPTATVDMGKLYYQVGGKMFLKRKNMGDDVNSQVSSLDEMIQILNRWNACDKVICQVRINDKRFKEERWSHSFAGWLKSQMNEKIESNGRGIKMSAIGQNVKIQLEGGR